MKRLLTTMLLSLSLIASAQSVLYRGKAAPSYSLSFNGHYFWASTSFETGTVCFQGRVYEDVLMNIDAFAQELVVKENPSAMMIAPDRDGVAWFTRGGVRFVNLRYAGRADAPMGYFEELTDGKALYYRQVVKKLYTEIGDHNGVEGIGYDDPDYRDKLLTYFQYYSFIYTVKNGELVKLRKGKAKRIYPHLRPAGNNGIGVFPAPYLEAREIAPSDNERRIARAIRAQKQASELPAGYFSEGGLATEHSALLDNIEQDNIIAMYRNKTYVIGTSTGSSRAKVSGRVIDVASGETLPGVTVMDKSGKNYTYTDGDGRYVLTLPCGDNMLSFRESSREDMDIRVRIDGDGSLDIVMKEKVTALTSAYITAESMAEHRRTKMGLEKINIKTIAKIPSAFGEGDVLKAVLTLPGVKTVGEAASGFNVRGGSSDQNLILFNEGTVYNPSHMFGIFSAFNTDVVDNLELYKSSIPVEYGGRISSVLDIHSKEGDSKKVKGSLGLGLLTSHLELEGPIVKDRTTFVLGGRTTYSNWILNSLPASSGYSGGRADFSDVNLGITHKLDDSNSLQAFGYWSRDKFSFSGDTTFRYNNLNVALKWKHKKGGSQITASAGFDRYGNILEDSFSPSQAYSLNTTIRQAYAKANFKNKIGDHTLSYGAEATFYSLNPGRLNPLGEESLIEARTLSVENALSPAVYAGDTWELGDKFSLDYGVRMSGLLALSPTKLYGGPEGRLSMKYSPASNLSFKAGFNSMNQYIHLISNTSSISPMDTWKLCDADIKPQRGWQAASGAYWTVLGGFLDLSVEGYYKRMWNYLDYKSGAVLTMNEHLSDDLVTTHGQAYGIEFMARKTAGKLSGWVSYTYSRTLLQEMEDRGTATINGGAWYPAAHDKPHDFKLVGNYQLTHRYSFSLNVDYSTGRPVTLPVGKFYYNGGWKLSYSERNGYRIPDYFRMDVAFNIDPGHYLKALTHMSATIGCYNVTGRKNAYSVYYTTNGGYNVKGYMISVFATQIPYLTLNLKF